MCHYKLLCNSYITYLTKGYFCQQAVVLVHALCNTPHLDFFSLHPDLFLIH